MANRIQLRRDTAANWTRENPVLSQGEPGFDLTANKLKVGDGVTAWADLAYASGSGDVSTATSWTATPASGNCPIYVELTPEHFEAYTQNSHLALRNDYTWSLGSNNNGNGIFSNDNTATIYSNYGQVVIRTGESFQHFTFTDAGRLQFPNGNILESIAGTSGANIQIIDNTGTFKIYTHATASALAWTFGPTGLLSTPGGIFIPNGDNQAGLSFSPNGSSTVGRISVDSGNNMTVNATADYSVKVSSYDRFYISSNVTTLIAGQDLVLKSNKNATAQVWTFGQDGSLNIPLSTTGAALIQTTGDISILATAKTWTFGANGNLTLPTGGQIKTAANTGTVVINTNNGATTSTWTFGTDGTVTFPDATVQTTAYQVVKSTFNASSPSVQIGNVQFSYNNSGNPTVAAVSGTWASSYTVEYQLWDGSAYTTYTTGNPSVTWTSVAAYGIGVTFAHAGEKAVAHFTDDTNSHIYRVTWLASSTNPTTNCTIIVEKLI